MVTFNHCLSCIRTSTHTVFLPFFFILRLNYVLSPIQLNLTLLKPNRYFPVPTRLETVMIGSLNDPLKFNLVDVRCQSVQHNSGSFHGGLRFLHFPLIIAVSKTYTRSPFSYCFSSIFTFLSRFIFFYVELSVFLATSRAFLMAFSKPITYSSLPE